MELGLYTFADTASGNNTDIHRTHNQRMKDLIEEIVLADQVGLDVFGIGEHHRKDYLVSSPATVLAAAAVLTKKIRLTSAVTVLSSDDPVRVFQDFATVDQLSNGRAEIMAGRGSFIESFPLFGYDLNDYDTLFAEKLELLLKLNESEIIDWKGQLRPSIDKKGVYPRPFQEKIPVWLAVGGTPNSARRAAKFGLPMAIAIIGGMPQQFIPFVDLYRSKLIEAGHTQSNLGINSIGYIAETSEQAAKEYYPYYAAMMDRIGKERGWQPMTRDHFDSMRTPHGSLLVGSPEEIIEKILYQYGLFKNSRFLIQMSVGTMPHDKIMKSIELFGTVVVPAVRKEIERQKTK